MEVRLGFHTYRNGRDGFAVVVFVREERTKGDTVRSSGTDPHFHEEYQGFEEIDLHGVQDVDIRRIRRLPHGNGATDESDTDG